TRESAAAPVTAHARHDDGAARPEFLDVSGIALTHGIRAGIVTRIDVVGPLVIAVIARIDPQPGQRLANAARRGGIRRHRLGESDRRGAVCAFAPVGATGKIPTRAINTAVLLSQTKTPPPNPLTGRPVPRFPGC